MGRIVVQHGTIEFYFLEHVLGSPRLLLAQLTLTLAFLEQPHPQNSYNSTFRTKNARYSLETRQHRQIWN